MQQAMRMRATSVTGGQQEGSQVTHAAVHASHAIAWCKRARTPSGARLLPCFLGTAQTDNARMRCCGQWGLIPCKGAEANRRAHISPMPPPMPPMPPPAAGALSFWGASVMMASEVVSNDDTLAASSRAVLTTCTAHQWVGAKRTQSSHL